MQPFIFSFVVPASMIDALGHMHYLNHRVIAEMAHVAFLASKGLSIEGMLAEGFTLHMREDSAVYNREVKLGDQLELHVTASQESIAAIGFAVDVILRGEVAASISYTMVTLSQNNPCPIARTPFKALVA